MAEWINPDRGEMFFARRVVFVEGETEKVVIPYLAEKLNIFDPDVSIIECGSKNNLPLYVSIAKAFDIPYMVIHDEDPLPDSIPADWSEDKIASKRRTFNLNQTISDLVSAPLGAVAVMAPDFEKVSGVSRSQGDRKEKALAALDHFDGISADDIPINIKEVLGTAYSAAADNHNGNDAVGASTDVAVQPG